MLRRHSTKSQPGFRRRKSTSSVQSVHLEHLDALLAQRDAKIAATHAFTRSQDRPSDDMSLFPPPLSPSTRGLKTSASGVAHSTSNGLLDGRSAIDDIRRHQSIRFVGQSPARHKSRNALSDKETGHSEEGDTTLLASPGRRRDDNTPRLKVLQSTENLRIRDISCGKNEQAPLDRLANSYLDALAAGDEYYTAEDNIASAPSSYRRLRRSRSLVCTGRSTDNSIENRRPPFHFTNSSPAQHRLPLSSTSPQVLRSSKMKDSLLRSGSTTPPPLRAPKSMSFLRSRRFRSTSSETHRDRDINILSAVPQTGRLSEQSQDSRVQPSLLFRSTKSRSEPKAAGMRKSLRSSSSNSAIPGPSVSTPLAIQKDGSLRDKARKVSKSLKSKIKNIFSLSKSDVEGTGLPAQHIESRKTHARRDFGSLPSTTFGSHSERSTTGAVLSRVPSRVASIHTVPSKERLRSRQGSLESLRSENLVAEEKSRVTSWASSNLTTAASQQQAWSEWERQRLSVIKENGAHAPSPSVHRPGFETPPMRSRKDFGIDLPVAPILPGPTIDSQRVYSALMKRLKETTQFAQIVEQQRQLSGDQSDPFRTMSSASLPDHSNDGCPSTPSPLTVRHVSDSDGQDYPAGRKHSDAESPLPSHEGLGTEVENPWAEQPSASGRQRDSSAATSTSRNISPPIDLAPHTERSMFESQALSDIDSALSGSPARHFFRTTSPYRRALQESMKAAEPVLEPSRRREASYIPSSSRPHLNRALSQESKTINAAYSDSVYSGQTSEDLSAEADLGHIVGMSSEPLTVLENGNIFVDHPIYNLRCYHSASSACSIDWKPWLAANASKLEPQLSPARSEEIGELEYGLSRMPKASGHGHIRERAQICGDEDEDALLQELPTRRLSMGPTPTASMEPNTSKLMPISRVAQRITPLPSPTTTSEQILSALDGQSQNQNTARDSYGPPPPLPPRSALRPKPSPLPGIVKSARDLKHNETQQPQTPDQTAATRRTKSLARLRSLNRLRATNTGSPYVPMSAGTKVPRRAERGLACSVGNSSPSTPGFSAALERQFGVASQHPTGVSDDKENIRVAGKPNSLYDVQGTGLSGSEVDPQVIGSQRMVDLFLSSRRRRMVSSEDAGAFI